MLTVRPRSADPKEQPGAAAGAHEPSCLFGTLFAAHPSMSHAELESENGDLGPGCAPRHITS